MEKQEEIGAVWKRVSLRRNPYFAGKITVGGVTVQIVLFPISGGTDEAPAFRILLAKLPSKDL